jgi:hypothetical protein
MNNFVPTERTTLKRLPKRGEYDREAVYEILDEAFVCHVGFISDGKPVVIPTSFGRIGDDLYIHGSAASRMLRSLERGVDVCVTVTLIDGLVLARSAFHHSINYRSVVIFGNAKILNDPDEKLAALHAFTDHIVAGRWEEVRLPTESELQRTLVLKLPLVEVSAKVRTGPPIDDEEDYDLPVWAGVLPLGIVASQPVNDDRLPADTQTPPYVTDYRRGASSGSTSASQWQRGEFTISTDKARLELEVVHRFLTTSYWATGRSIETVRRSIENSIPFGVYKGDQQIGFARVITDYATFAWIADVFILEAFRSQGLSKWLMEVIISHPELQGFRRWVLATKDAHELYRKFGFTELKLPERWMERHDPNTQERPDYWSR